MFSQRTGDFSLVHFAFDSSTFLASHLGVHCGFQRSTKGEAPEFLWIHIDHRECQRRSCYGGRFTLKVHRVPHTLRQVKETVTKDGAESDQSAHMTSAVGIFPLLVAERGNIRFREQDIGDDVDNSCGNGGPDDAHMNHLTELLHH